MDGVVIERVRAASMKIGGPTAGSIGVTSAIHGEGRTSIALALAHVHSHDYLQRVLLVDLDVNSHDLAIGLRASVWPGLAQVAAGEKKIGDVIQSVNSRIDVVGAGVGPRSASRVLMDLASSDVFAQLVERYQAVIVDLPPIIPTPEAAAICRRLRRTLLVVRAGATPAARVREAASALPTPPRVVLNATRTAVPGWLRRLAGLQ
jgi:Mrp family chromosome partitioning ATPase